MPLIRFNLGANMIFFAALVFIILGLSLHFYNNRNRFRNTECVRIIVDDLSVCSGVLLEQSWILTARHCVQEPNSGNSILADRINVEFSNGEFILVDQIKVPYNKYDGIADLKGTDIALLKLAIKIPEEKYFLPSTYFEADRAFVLLPDGHEFKKSEVTILAMDEENIYARLLTSRGDSGSPLVSSKGHLIGLLSWRPLQSADEAIAVFNRIGPLKKWINLEVSGRDCGPSFVSNTIDCNEH